MGSELRTESGIRFCDRELAPSVRLWVPSQHEKEDTRTACHRLTEDHKEGFEKCNILEYPAVGVGGGKGYRLFIILHRVPVRRKQAVRKYLWEGREIVIVFISQKPDSLSPTMKIAV